MENEDIIGREFTVFKFEKFKLANWYVSDDKYIGAKGVVLNVHSQYPEYVNVEIRSKAGARLATKHFPTHLIKEHFEEMKRENRSIDELIIEMKQLISRI